MLAADIGALCRSPTCPLTILAMSLYNGALGGYAYYGPKAARDVFQLGPETGDLLFGVITVATGVGLSTLQWHSRSSLAPRVYKLMVAGICVIGHRRVRVDGVGETGNWQPFVCRLRMPPGWSLRLIRRQPPDLIPPSPTCPLLQACWAR